MNAIHATNAIVSPVSLTHAARPEETDAVWVIDGEESKGYAGSDEKSETPAGAE
jgi:hypothetical protein